MNWTRFTLVLGAALMITATTWADDLIISDMEFVSGVVNGNVIVLSGGLAVLSGATIDGNVIVEPGGTLDSTGGSTINGNIQADGPAAIALFNEQIGGDIQIKKAIGFPGVGLFSCTVLGNVQLEENDVSLITLGFPGINIGNVIYGDLQVFKNSGIILIADNDVGGNLQCGENEPAPQLSGNIVIGNIECDD